MQKCCDISTSCATECNKQKQNWGQVSYGMDGHCLKFNSGLHTSSTSQVLLNKSIFNSLKIQQPHLNQY